METKEPGLRGPTEVPLVSLHLPLGAWDPSHCGWVPPEGTYMLACVGVVGGGLV